MSVSSRNATQEDSSTSTEAKTEKQGTSKEWDDFNQVVGILQRFVPSDVGLPADPDSWHLGQQMDHPTLKTFARREQWDHYESHMIVLGISYHAYLAPYAKMASLFDPKKLAEEIIGVQPMKPPKTLLNALYGRYGKEPK